MSDEIDKGQEREQTDREFALKQARSVAQAIPVGVAGECGLCGEWSGRIVEGACAPCRDKHHLP
ncbi:conjugal transfer protein TraR [bacterium (Candidatus Blackallbacteria) CG18_big_fil_WC_8_21_14_2_50_49_26]|nr:MAG: conjugal transfer protein TraR [bacterium (Candidatus Blackallbacteria) CG18_big_fil_WC_8_21_14_2_50_49_26]